MGRFYTLVVIVGVAALVIRAHSAAAGDAPAAVTRCPVTQSRVIPAAYRDDDAPATAGVPFVADAALIPGDDDGRHARYQQWIAPDVFSDVVSLTALRFRVDASTPLALVAGDLTYALEVAIGTGPLAAAELAPVLEENASGLTRVFGGTVTIAGDAATPLPLPSPSPPPPSDAGIVAAGVPSAATGEMVEIIFEAPVLYDPAIGGLLIDVKVVGLFGDALPMLLDAAVDPSTVAHFTTDETIDPSGTPLPASPVLTLQYVDGEVLNDIGAACLETLPLTGGAHARLARALEGARRAADRDNLRAAARRLTAYRRAVERLETKGEIAPDVAAMLDTLGADEAVALDGGLGLLRALIGLLIRSEYGMALFAIERTSTPFLPRGQAGREIRTQTQIVDAAVDVAFADAGGGVMATSAHDTMVEELCELLEKARKAKKVDKDLVQSYEDLKAAVEDKDLLLEMIQALVDILDDTKLDKTDVDDLKTVKDALKKIREKTSEDGELRKGISQFLRLICSLTSLLDSGKLTSLTAEVVDGKLVLTFDVTEEIEIRIAELLDLDTESDYGKTNIYFDLHVKKDATISFCPTGEDKMGNEQAVIDFEPDDAVDLDLDSSGIWVVHVLEDVVGVPDLDHVCLGEIRVECGMVAFEGKSGGKTVKINADSAEAAKKNPKKSGVTVEVDGEQTFPKK